MKDFMDNDVASWTKILEIFQGIIASIFVFVMHLNDFREFVVRTASAYARYSRLFKEPAKIENIGSLSCSSITEPGAIFCSGAEHRRFKGLFAVETDSWDHCCTHPFPPAFVRTKVELCTFYNRWLDGEMFSTCVTIDGDLSCLVEGNACC